MIKPLLAIMSPRDIPWLEEKTRRVDYVDKVWFKYTPTDVTIKRIVKYFNEHKEYTHLILHSDDGAPEYEHVAMLIADAEKYDFDVICGCCCMDRMSEDLFLNLTFNQVTTKLMSPLVRTNYHLLPIEFTELNGILEVWFEGNALALMKRSVIEKVGLRPWFGRFGADIRFSFDSHVKGVKKFADLRVYMDHFKYPQYLPPFNIKIKNIEPKTIVVKATKPIPKMEPAELISELPEKYVKLMDLYYGKPKKLNICIVTEFEQTHFQWYNAFKQYAKLDKRFGGHLQVSEERNHFLYITKVIMNPSTISVHRNDKLYWKPISEADIVFVYCARQQVKDTEGKPWEWFNLPVMVKKFMKPDAKLIAQFDDEFVWLWNKNHIFWKYPPEFNLTPEEFFLGVYPKVLNVADAYFTVLKYPRWAKFTDKPIFYMPLPQTTRYIADKKKIYRPINPYRKIAILRHSVKSASIDNLINNVIKVLNVPVILFTTDNSGDLQKMEYLKKLPPKSEVYGNVDRESYMRFLRTDCTFAAIDDNDGYEGWSRFAFECAISGIPVIGSTVAAKYLFPKLAVEHGDSAGIIEKFNQLIKNETFYKYQRLFGFYRSFYALSSPSLVSQFLEIVLIDLEYEAHSPPDAEIERDGLVAMMVDRLRRGHGIPNRPSSSGSVFDGYLKRNLSASEWDNMFGKYRKWLDNAEEFRKIKIEVNERSRNI